MACKLCFAATADDCKVSENFGKWAEIILKQLNITFTEPIKTCQDCLKKLNEIHDFCEFVKQRQHAAIKLKKVEVTAKLKEPETVIPDNIKLEFNVEDEELLAEQHDWVDDRKLTEENQQAIREAQKFSIKKDADTFIRNNCEGNTICKVCDKTFKSLANLRIHAVTKHLNRKFVCKICSEVSYSKRDSQRHIEKHKIKTPASKDAEFTCKVCFKAFKTKVLLSNHERNGHKFKHFCGICKMKFAKKLSLDLHVALEHKDSTTTSEDIDDRTCIICNQLYKSTAALRTHMSQIHHNETPFQCTMCSRSFKENMARRKHFEQVHCGLDKDGSKPEDRHCIICNFGFHRMAAFRTHMETMHKGARPFACDLCERRFQSRPTLRKHIQNIHKLQINRDSIDQLSSTESENQLIEGGNVNDSVTESLIGDKENSSKVSTSISEPQVVNAALNDNVENNTQDWQSGYTEDPLSREVSLNEKLMDTESTELLNDNSSNALISIPITVKDAENANSNKYKVTSYARIQTFIKYDSEGKALCSFCSRCDQSLPSLYDHIERNHLRRICSICHKEFLSYRQLFNHTRDNHKNEQFCSICQTAFKNVHGFLLHNSRIHNNRHTCFTCGITFPKKLSLCAHIARGHKEENNDADGDDVRDRTCVICKKLYKTVAALYTHMREVHNNQAAHKCSDCELKFRTKSQLHRHYNKAHTSVPNPRTDRHCIICDTSFENIKVLKDHMRNVHPGECPYTCETCTSRFVLKSSYLRHINDFCAKRKKSESNCQNITDDGNEVVSAQTAVHVDAILENDARLDVSSLGFKCPGGCNLEFNDSTQLCKHYTDEFCPKRRKFQDKSSKTANNSEENLDQENYREIVPVEPVLANTSFILEEVQSQNVLLNPSLEIFEITIKREEASPTPNESEFVELSADSGK